MITAKQYETAIKNMVHDGTINGKVEILQYSNGTLLARVEMLGDTPVAYWINVFWNYRGKAYRLLRDGNVFPSYNDDGELVLKEIPAAEPEDKLSLKL